MTDSRYNISTAEYDGWDGGIDSSVEQQSNVQVLDGSTTDGNPTRRRKIISSLSSVYTQFGFGFEEAAEVSANIVLVVDVTALSTSSILVIFEAVEAIFFKC